MKQTKEQLSLLAFGDMDKATANVFEQTEKKDENQVVLASSTHLLKNKDIAAKLGLDVKDDKDAIAEAILVGKDQLLAKMAQIIVKAQSDEFWTGGGVKVLYSKAGKSGKLSKAKLILSLEEARRPAGPNDEAIAKALHMSVEDVAAMRERQLKALAAQNVDVESTTTRTETPDEQAARELAEEQQRLAESNS